MKASILKWAGIILGVILAAFGLGRLGGRVRGAAEQRAKDAGEVKKAHQGRTRAEAEADKEKIRVEAENRARSARSADLGDVYRRAESWRDEQDGQPDDGP